MNLQNRKIRRKWRVIVAEKDKYAQKDWLNLQRRLQNPKFNLVTSDGVHPNLVHQVVFVVEVILVLLSFSPHRKPYRHYLGTQTEWNRRKLLCEYFLVIISIFKMLKTAKHYALHFILAGLFSGTGLIILCQPLESNIWAVILIKMITSIALWNGKQNCWNERLCYNYLKWTAW